MSIEQDLIMNSQENIKTNEVVREAVSKTSISAEEEKAKAETKIQQETKNNKKIEDLREEILKKIEGENFGEARIDNPKILDLIAEIEHCQILDPEEKEIAMQKWKYEMAADIYKEALEDYRENIDSPDDSQGAVFYGLAGIDRFVVEPGGNIYLQHSPGSNLIAEGTARKRAKELGMEVRA